MAALSKSLVKATCLSIALLGATAVVSSVMVPDMAYAKSEKSKDKAKSKSKSKSKAKAARKSKNEKKIRPIAKASKNNRAADGKKVFNGKGNRVIQELAAAGYAFHPSELGALNAWNGKSDTAADGSTVGKLNMFRQAVADGLVMKSDLDAARAIIGDLVVADDTYAVYDGTGTLLGYDLLAAEVDLGAELLTQEEFDAMVSYQVQQAAINDLEKTYQDNLAMEETYLRSAANKPVSDELLEAFRAILGATS